MRFTLRAVCTAAAWICLLPGAAFAGPPVVKIWPGVAPLARTAGKPAR
jgi:hypothetical protein